MFFCKQYQFFNILQNIITERIGSSCSLNRFSNACQRFLQHRNALQKYSTKFLEFSNGILSELQTLFVSKTFFCLSVQLKKVKIVNNLPKITCLLSLLLFILSNSFVKVSILLSSFACLFCQKSQKWAIVFPRGIQPFSSCVFLLLYTYVSVCTLEKQKTP